MLLSACAGKPERVVTNTRDVIVQVPVSVPLPAELLEPCPLPDQDKPLTVGALMRDNLNLIANIEACNAQLRAIRDLQPTVDSGD